MNKHQEVLGSLWSAIYYEPKEFILERRKENEEHLKTLQELVNKATPKEMVNVGAIYGLTYYICPVCNELVRGIDKYCSSCGQRIDTIVGDGDE